MLMNRLFKKKKLSLNERLARQAASTTKAEEKEEQGGPINYSLFNFNSTENTHVGNGILPSNVIPLKTRKLANDYDEKKRVERIAKQIAKNFEKTADSAGCYGFYPWYYLLFYIQQRMIYSLPYFSYRTAVAEVEKQIISNHKEFLAENCPEWREDNKTITKEEKDKKEKTIH